MSWHPLLFPRTPWHEQTIELLFENRWSTPHTPRSSDAVPGLAADDTGRCSAGSGPLGENRPAGTTSGARGSRSDQGRTDPGAFGRRGLSASATVRGRCGAARGSGAHAVGGARAGRAGNRGRGWFPGQGRARTRGRHVGPHRPVRRAHYLLPSRTARPEPADALRSYAWPQPGTPRARPLRFGAENGKRASRFGCRHARCPGPLIAGRVSAWPRTRARRPPGSARRPRRSIRPAPRRPTPSR